MVWLNHYAVLDLANRHRRMRCEQFHHLTAMSRREMLNDDEGRTAFRRHRREKIAERFQSTSRSPKPHHIESLHWFASHHRSSYGWFLRFHPRPDTCVSDEPFYAF